MDQISIAAKDTAPDSRTIFLVHGRNKEARAEVSAMLRAMGLHILEWHEAIGLSATGANPHIGEILKAGLSAAQAVVVLFTGDDVARLGRRFGPPERLQPQSRPNVLFEAGMAMGRSPNRTIFVQIGENRAFSDIAGLHFVQLDDSEGRRRELAKLLEVAGCAVDTKSHGDWLTAGNIGKITTNPDGKDKLSEVSKFKSALLAVVALFAVGITCFWAGRTYEPSMLRVRGEVKTDKSITIYVVSDEQTFQKDGKIVIDIPVLPRHKYHAEYISEGKIVNEKEVPTEASTVDLGHFENQITLPSSAHGIVPEIRENDEQVKQFLSKGN